MSPPDLHHHLSHQNNKSLSEQILQRLTNIIPTTLSYTATLGRQIGNLSSIGLVAAVLLGAAAYYYYYYIVVTADKKNNGRHRQLVFSRSMSVGALHGGQFAIQRLVEYHDARANRASLQSAEDALDSLLNEDRPDFKKLQRVVGRLEMSGKEGKAVERLEGAVKKAGMQGKPHEAYEFDMLLVEMLIYKGDFKKALSRPCLKDESITDARRPLYKAMIHLLLEDCSEEEVQRLWKEFRRIQKHFRKSHSSQAPQLHEAARHFDTFKNIVMSLKDDIRHTTLLNAN
ncbi:PREDICTED: uncharacterized protein LOC109164925 [Ipomoea nil]|uniref:uncharacterized protein LOC109164925 n=1 Tax=Ipomoea nil TaxID=35883 RepID=UPI000900C789|nr:PREDICTED: uncharacterized protein LOC109164925 [Ipomoea nil]